MYENENNRAIHVMILLCYTIFTAVLTGESILLGWDMSAVVLLLLGLAVSWGLHITKILPESTRQWIYFILTMLLFFFYGIHETSIYDMAPVMIFVIIMYSVTEMYIIIRLCMVVYYFTMIYDFVFVLGGKIELSPLLVTRILLHFGLVFMSGQIAKYVIKIRKRERVDTEDKITKLEKINRRTEDFFANVSHELRTPLNVVMGISSVMLKNEENDGKRENIISIQNAGYRLFEQIEDILDYTEIDTGRISVNEENYMISSLVNDIIIGKKMQEKENMPELIFDIDAGIPSVLVGDVKKIKKIISHLIDNSIKFTKKGGVYVRIYALNKSYGINLYIKVSDTGVGISEDDLKKITEKFYQSSSERNRRANGLELGLSIVYGLVAAMEGFMKIESTVGSGTTISISIPQKVSDSSPSMSVDRKADLCVAVFLRPEKYESPEVRSYYNELISNMVKGLGIFLHRVFNVTELERLISMYAITHLFIGREEYEEDKLFFEKLNENMQVIVVADDNFNLSHNSGLKLLRKPFYCFPVVSILNGVEDKKNNFIEKGRIIYPGLKVLVVDDEPMNLMVAEGIFNNYQMLVTTSASGREAVSLCEKENFDIIFLDHMMPEMDGVETLKRLRKISDDYGKGLTIIAFTANAVSGAREMFLKEGFDEFISKPIETTELERVLRKVLPREAVKYADEKYLDNKKEENTDVSLSKENLTFSGQPDGADLEENILNGLEKVGINTQEGLHYCCEDMDFYLELLLKFAEAQVQKENELNDCFEREDYENYRIFVHALKSTAKMIGADRLSEMAKQSEEAAKNADEEYIRAHHTQLIYEYGELAINIFGLLKNDTGETVQAEDKDDIENKEDKDLSQEELLGLLEELKKCLDTFEADKSESAISEMSKLYYRGTSVAQLLGEIKEKVEDFEFSDACEKVDELIRRIKGGEAS